VDGGEDDDYSIMTVSPAKLRNVKDLRLKIKEDASAVSTEKSSCSNRSISANAGIEFGRERGDKNGAFEPAALSKSVDIMNVENCKNWVDHSGTGGYVVNLDVFRPGDPEFD